MGCGFPMMNPIQIESDQLEIKEQEKKAYFTGNVKVVQGTNDDARRQDDRALHR
jgi:lipopolysaccharide assembly outer membrane protein LptD (OstA)